MAKKYGTEVAERLKAFGGDGRRLIEQYGDELADIIGRLSDGDVKKAIELINAYGDDAISLLRSDYSLSYTQMALKYGTGKNKFSDWDSMKEFYKGKVTKFVKDCKPKYSPKPKTWFEKGGTIEIDINNGQLIWEYTNSSGVSVQYIDGYIQFPDDVFYQAVKQVDIGHFSGNRSDDISKMLDILERVYKITEIPDGYVVHHDIEDGILQLIEEEVHKQFTHIGGHSLCGGN